MLQILICIMRFIKYAIFFDNMQRRPEFSVVRARSSLTYGGLSLSIVNDPRRSHVRANQN